MARTLVRHQAVAIVHGLALAAPAQAQLTVTQDAPRRLGQGRRHPKKVTVDHTRKRVKLKTKMYRGNGLPQQGLARRPRRPRRRGAGVHRVHGRHQRGDRRASTCG